MASTQKGSSTRDPEKAAVATTLRVQTQKEGGSMYARAIRLVIAVVAAATVFYGNSAHAQTCDPLQNGVSVTTGEALKGRQLCFSISVPAGQTFLAVSLSGGSGNTDLYLRLGVMPTLRTYDCRNAGKTNNETCTISNPGAGTWYVMLNATTTFSGASLTATFTGQSTCTQLESGVALPNLAAASSAQTCFKLGLPAGHTSLVVTTSGGSGNADLYVRFGSVPSLRTYSCRSVGKTNNETCTISYPGAGTWYVMLNAASAFTGVTLKATAQGGPLVVNSIEDSATPPPGTTTLRSALAAAGSGVKITFDASLDGATIPLSIVGDYHSILKGEVYVGMTYSGYQDRDYGRSALYAHKNVVIDASMLPNGITLEWTGGVANPARVLAVYGSLTLNNVSIVSGSSVAEPIVGNTAQPYTVARGAGIAVWGTATLTRCTIAGNTINSEAASGRDLAAYGGGIYANGLDLRECIVSGNKAIGSGAAGGGIYSVGGADNTTGYGNDTYLDRCTVSGNLVRAANAYGGGIFSLAGGPSNLATMHITNSTVARNVVEQHPAYATPYYYRGGGVYMGGGSLEVVASTITENAVNGTATTIGGKPNMGGGGVAATIGNAHTVESVWLQNSIVVGNTLNDAPEDWFAGSLIDFNSGGYNLIGTIDFSQILVPIPPWLDLSRKHWPKNGDFDGVALSEALDVGAAQFDTSIVSAGTDAGGPAVLWYPPGAAAIDKIPDGQYQVSNVYGGYSGYGTSSDDFLNHVLAQVRQQYGAILGSDFGSSFGDMTGTTWYGPARTWPSEPQNQPWIAFWRQLDVEIGDALGMVVLGDAFWGTFTTGYLDSNLYLTINRVSQAYTHEPYDELGSPRPSGSLVDIGAIEQ